MSIVFLRYMWRQSARKKIRVSIAYSWKANALIEFYHFMKNDDEVRFFIPPFSKIGRRPCKEERILSIYEIMKLLQYSYHHMNSIHDKVVANMKLAFTIIPFRHHSTYVVQKWLKIGWSSRSDYIFFLNKYLLIYPK